MNNNNIKEYIQTAIENNKLADLFTVVYPRDKTEKSAQQIANQIEAAVGIVQLKDENDNLVWGVLLDKKYQKKD